MALKFTIDRSGCINCGICVDVCPVQALDMTRPNRRGLRAAISVGRQNLIPG